MRGYFECAGCGGDFSMDGSYSSNISGDYICENCYKDAVHLAVWKTMQTAWTDKNGVTDKWQFHIECKQDKLEMSCAYYDTKALARERALEFIDKLLGEDVQIVEE